MSNFKFDVDADGIALITWDMPGKSMNVIDTSVMEELDALVDKVAGDAAIKGAVVTSGKDTFGGGADLTMLEKQRDDYMSVLKSKGEEAANHDGVRLLAPSVADLSQARDQREAVGRGAQRHRDGRLLRARARLPSPHRVRQSEDAPRPARDQGRAVPRRGRHAAHRAHDGDRGRAAVPAQGRPDPARPRQDHEAGRQRRAGRRPRQRREELDQDLAEVEAAVGRGRLQAARRPDLVEDGHDDLAGRERALPQGDAGQLPGRARDPVERVRGPAGAVRHRAAHRVALLRQDHALARGGGDDPLAVRLDAGAEQGRAPPGQSACDQPEEGRRDRRRPDGRGHRLRHGAGRHRRGADRPRPGSGRQGQGLFGEHHGGPDQARPRQAGRRRRAARAHHADAGLRRSSRASTSSSRRCSRTAR